MANSFNINFRDGIIHEDYYVEHSHDFVELDFFVIADVQIFSKDRKHTVKDGDMLLIGKNDLHKIIYNNGKRYRRYVISFREDVLTGIFKNVSIAEMCSKISLPVNVINEVEFVCKNMLKTYNRYMDDYLLKEMTLRSYLTILLVKFYENIPVDDLEENDYSFKVIKYIDENYTQNISLDCLEKELSLNKYYLSHVFKEKTGLTIVEYVHYRRIAEAQKRLKDKEQKPIDICYSCGFNNMQHFYRVFRKITGLSPEKYRKSI